MWLRSLGLERRDGGRLLETTINPSIRHVCERVAVLVGGEKQCQSEDFLYLIFYFIDNYILNIHREIQT